MSRHRGPTLSRRALLRQVMLGSGALLWACNRPTPEAAGSAGSPGGGGKIGPRADHDAALAVLQASARADVLGRISGLIEAGLTREDLRAALVAAWAGVDGDVHGGLALHAWLALERELAPRQQLLALFRACDHVVAHREAWKPWPVAGSVPAVLLGLDRKELVARTRGAFDRLDAAGTRLGVRALHKRWGQEVVSAELLRMAAREDGSGGHGTHNVVAGLDLLRVVNWRGADAVLDQLASRLQPPGSWQAPPSDRARLAFAAHQRMVREAGEGWQGGVRRLEATRALRQAARTDRGEALVAQVRKALGEQIHADALWDGLALAAADMALRDPAPAGPGIHALLLVAALRQAAVRAPTPQSRLIALLGAAWRLPDHRPPVAVGASPTAVALGDGATLVAADARTHRANRIRQAAAAGGAPSLAVRDGMRDLLLQKAAVDPHTLELPIAATRLAAVCAPPLQGDILAAVAASGPDADSPDWSGWADANRLARALRAVP